MSKLDYEKLGFKAGLEIHQQLEGKKLFCNCPTTIREDEHHFEVARFLRASVGESGEVDIAASHEQAKQKRFVYQGYQDTTCLVELDEQPVSQPNARCVETGVMVAKLFGMHCVDRVCPMRKVVVDGSNTSGFQRTMVLAFGGKVKDVRLSMLCLEEDSAKVVSREQDKDVYNLSRLGIPLFEVTTEPDIKNPDHLQEIAAYIGMALRSTGRVKRGLGTIRQDVNVSIAGGARQEIKGVQNLDLMPLIAENEVRRQLGLLGIHGQFNVSFDEPKTVSKHFKDSEGWIPKALKTGVARGVKVSGGAGLFGSELYKGFRFGTEVAGFAKAWGFGGIIHGDEDPKKYGLDSWNSLEKEFSCKEDDGFFLLVGDEKKISTVIPFLEERVQTLLSHVPSEVRKANDDGTSSYLRPMPGSARMYPETDSRPFILETQGIEAPELLVDKIGRIQKETGATEGLLKQLLREDLLEEFHDAVLTHGKKSLSAVQDCFWNTPRELEQKKNLLVTNEQRIAFTKEYVGRLMRGEVASSALTQAYEHFVTKGHVQWEKFKPVDESELIQVIAEIVAADPDAPFGALMGEAMKRLGGKADGKTVSRLLREALK